MGASVASRGELVAGSGKSRAQVALMTHVKSTWLLSSVLAVRESDHYEAYLDGLDPLFRSTIVDAVAGSWLPVEVFAAHYAACDRLALAESEQVEMGAQVTRRVHGVMMSFGLRLAQETGVTPWTALAQAPPLFSRVARGGEVSVYRLGPKEARLDLLGYPVARSTYARLAMRGAIAAILRLVARRAFVSDLRSLGGPHSLS